MYTGGLKTKENPKRPNHNCEDGAHGPAPAPARSCSFTSSSGATRPDATLCIVKLSVGLGLPSFTQPLRQRAVSARTPRAVPRGTNPDDLQNASSAGHLLSWVHPLTTKQLRRRQSPSGMKVHTLRRKTGKETKQVTNNTHVFPSTFQPFAPMILYLILDSESSRQCLIGGSRVSYQDTIQNLKIRRLLCAED